MKINTYIHTYIHTQMILVYLLCIQASMLSYPILLRWVKTPIEKKVPLVSMSIQSTYSTCIHQHTYQVSHVLTFHLPIIGIHLFIHTCLHTYITITGNTLLFWQISYPLPQLRLSSTASHFLPISTQDNKGIYFHINILFVFGRMYVLDAADLPQSDDRGQPTNGWSKQAEEVATRKCFNGPPMLNQHISSSG